MYTVAEGNGYLQFCDAIPSLNGNYDQTWHHPPSAVHNGTYLVIKKRAEPSNHSFSLYNTTSRFVLLRLMHTGVTGY